MSKETNILKYSSNKKVNKTIRCKVIEIPIYNLNIKILFGDKATKLEKDWGKDYKGFGGLTRNYLQSNKDILISFPDNNPKLEYVVHELYHAVDMIINHIGHKKNDDADEPSAYLMGYLINEYKKLK